jgi:LPS export ABC transporter protein LptC
MSTKSGFVSVVSPVTIIMIFITVLGAIAVGWIYESRSKDNLVRPELEIPTDIDFFLSQLNYRVFNRSGGLDYQLQSPYLEHFIKNDISRIKQPMIQVYRESGDWQLEALHGAILHRQEWVQFDNNVVMEKVGAESIRVRSDSIIFKPDQDQVSTKTTVIIESNGARITGDQAIFDLRNEVYSLNNTRAIYYHADD